MTLSPYQNLLLYYGRLQEAYGWTMNEVDEHAVAFLLDQLLAVCLQDSGRRYIDDVL